MNWLRSHLPASLIVFSFALTAPQQLVPPSTVVFTAVSTLEHVQARGYYRIEEPTSAKWPASTPKK